MKSLYRYLWVPAILMLVQSCFVAKNYESPQIEMAESYRLDTQPEDSTSLADIPWQEVFTDTLLQSYIDSALDNNLDIRIAIENIKAAQAFLRQARAGNEPTLNAQLNYAGQHPSKYGQNGNLGKDFINQYDLTANLSWEADIWGKINSQKKAVKAQYLQTVAAQKAVKTNLIASIASIYYQLLVLDDQSKTAKESIKSRKESLETTRALKQAGFGQVNAAAVKRSEAQVYDAQITLLNLQKVVKQLENTFSILLAVHPHTIKRGSLSEQEINTELKTGVPSLLLENRPDVIAAEYGLINAFQMTNVAKANFYPSLTLTASTGIRSLEIEHWLSANAIFGSIAAGLLQPILNRRQIRTQYEVALSDKEIALLNYKNILLNAGREVSDALEDYQSATQTITIQKKQVKALELATSYSQTLLNNGFANYLEVLTAQQQELGAQLQLADSKYQRLNAIVTLYQALGGGWK